MVDELFRNQTDWVVAKPIPALLKIAKQAGLTQQQFGACLSNRKMLDGIDWMRERAAENADILHQRGRYTAVT